MKKQFIIESPHTEEECMEVMDSVADLGDEVLLKFVWACPSGEHIAWALVDADSIEDALSYIPELVRERSKAVEVLTLDTEGIRTFHELGGDTEIADDDEEEL